MHKYTAMSVARSKAPYSAQQIDHGSMASAKDLTSKDPGVSTYDRKNPTDGAVNTLGRYGKYQTPSARAKKHRKKQYLKKKKL